MREDEHAGLPSDDDVGTLVSYSIPVWATLAGGISGESAIRRMSR